MSEQKVFRCAVYTRKSTEEGLDQDFNSLQAQREACEAFIRSQKGEGWTLVPAAYDDGGISGGTMERPALKRLFAHIEEKRVDVIVVYKVDRLTRSLADFSKMVEVFDRRGVSFVAVTQQFNTTTSMGRLTLNVLLSFAQFEREVTAERIRDKIAASKKKGIWMGGGIPRGYRVEDRKLFVVPEEAEVVRHIYTRYLKCASIRELAFELKQEGITARRGFLHTEEKQALSRGALYGLLRSPIYAGMISHKGELYEGQHKGIIDPALWEAVQLKLRAGSQSEGRQLRTVHYALKGKLFDSAGRLLTPHHTNKIGRRYRYYISHSDHRYADRLQHEERIDWKLAAAEIEARVGEIARLMLSDQAELARAAMAASVSTFELEALLQCARDATPAKQLDWVERVVLHPDRIEVRVRLPARVELRLEQTIAMTIKRRGIERRLVIASDIAKTTRPDLQIIKALRIGLKFWQQLNSNAPVTAVEFAAQERTDNRYVGRAIRLTFLAPDILERFALGQHAPDWTAERLLQYQLLPLCWDDQRSNIR